VWLIPLFVVVGAVFVAASGRSERVARRPQGVLPSGPPGPISVLGEFVRFGQSPPPMVILCAIAEAEAIGRADLAHDIIQAFVVPVVQAWSPAPPAWHYTTQLPMPVPAQLPRTVQPQQLPASVTTPLLQRPALMSLPPPDPVPSITSSDEEIQALLDADPRRFVAAVSRPVPPEVIQAPVEVSQRPVVPVVPVVPAMSAAGSPLAGVSDAAWIVFVARIEREDPSFVSSRHVGRYRQRRERLAELGLDERLLETTEGQRAALDADLADAHRRASDGELLFHLGRPVALPGQDEAAPLTLSGLLGVIQCAGLEGAAGWLERPGDRRKYPHTSNAFQRTNGLF